MALSFVGKLFFGGLGLYALGTLLEKEEYKRRVNTRNQTEANLMIRKAFQTAQDEYEQNTQTTAYFTPENAEAYLTQENLDCLWAYAQEYGITFEEALQVACDQWNLAQEESLQGNMENT